MRDILEQDYLNIESEDVLFKALSKWSNENEEEAEDLLGLIRFMAMTPKQVELSWLYMFIKDVELLAESADTKDPDLIPEGKIIGFNHKFSFTWLNLLTYQ